MQSLRFLALLDMVGVALSGLVWLAVYHFNWTPALNFEGPAVFGLGITLTAGWLLSTVVGLTLYLRGNQSKKVVQAVMVVIVCGLIAGIGTGYLLTNYALSHYNSVCGRHLKMC